MAGHEYGLVAGNGASLDAGGKVTLQSGSTITLFATPDGQDSASLAKLAADPVVGTSVDHSVDGDTVKTTLNYVTKNGGDTAIAPMAGQTVAGGTKSGGTYASIYGTMDVYSGSSLTTTAPLAEPSDQLDVSGMSDEDKQAVIAQIKTDAASIDFAASATDTYFGGKMLYRAANLMTLAEQLGVTDVATTLRTGLTAELKKWFTPKGCDTAATKCFVYDDAIKSIIGLEASFGSDEENDHHFHYGYMLYAAAVVAENDKALADEIAPVVDLLAADIASDQATADFPQYRNFDPYSGSCVGLRFLAVRGREQPGVLQRVGQRLERPGHVGQGPRQHRSVQPGRLDDERRGQLGQALLDEHRPQRVPRVHPQDRRAELGWQAGLRDLVQPGARAQCSASS